MISDVISADELADALSYVVQEIDRDSAEVVLSSLSIGAIESVAKCFGVENDNQDHEAGYLVVEIMKRIDDRGF